MKNVGKCRIQNIGHIQIIIFNESGNTVQIYFTERVSLQLRPRLGKEECEAQLVFCWAS